MALNVNNGGGGGQKRHAARTSQRIGRLKQEGGGGSGAGAERRAGRKKSDRALKRKKDMVTLDMAHPVFSTVSHDGLAITYEGKANHTHDVGVARTSKPWPGTHVVTTVTTSEERTTSNKDVYPGNNVDNTSEFVAVVTKKTVTRRVRVSNKGAYRGQEMGASERTRPASATGPFAPHCRGTNDNGKGHGVREPYYFEAKILSSGVKNDVSIGLVNGNTRLNQHPGTSGRRTFGYFAKDGVVMAEGAKWDPNEGVQEGQKVEPPPPYEEGDVVGCGVHFDEEMVFFTKNGALVCTVQLSPAPHQPYTIDHGSVVDVCSLDEGMYGSSLWSGQAGVPTESPQGEDELLLDRKDEDDELDRARERRKRLRTVPPRQTRSSRAVPNKSGHDDGRKPSSSSGGQGRDDSSPQEDVQLQRYHEDARRYYSAPPQAQRATGEHPQRTRLQRRRSSNHPVLQTWGRNAHLLQDYGRLMHGGYPTPRSYSSEDAEQSRTAAARSHQGTASDLSEEVDVGLAEDSAPAAAPSAPEGEQFSPVVRLYPAIAVHSAGERVRAIFDEEKFMFNPSKFIEKLVEQRRKHTSAIPVSEKVIASIINEYLHASGYQKTLETFMEKEAAGDEPSAERVPQSAPAGRGRGDKARSPPLASPVQLGGNKPADPTKQNVLLKVRSNIRTMLVSSGDVQGARQLITEYFPPPKELGGEVSSSSQPARGQPKSVHGIHPTNYRAMLRILNLQDFAERVRADRFEEAILFARENFDANDPLVPTMMMRILQHGGDGAPGTNQAHRMFTDEYRVHTANEVNRILSPIDPIEESKLGILVSEALATETLWQDRTRT